MIGNLTALLKTEYRQQGFSLTEDEDFLYLYHGGKVVGVFSSHGATIDAVERHIRGEVLCEKHGDIYRLGEECPGCMTELYGGK